MGQCNKCGDDTKYPLCFNCYSEEKDARKVPEKKGSLSPSGLTEMELEYRYNMIKARIAETLVEELFLSLGWGVFRYGMENTIPGVMNLLSGVRTDVANNIRRMPDFVVQDKNRDVFFVEVKFRASEMFSISDLPRDYPFGNAYIVLVSKRHIKCITVNELRAGKSITPTCHHYLGNRKEFDLDKETIKSFCDFAIKFFDNVD